MSTFLKASIISNVYSMRVSGMFGGQFCQELRTRIARVVLPGVPHHISQRGVRSMRVFFSDDGRTTYLRFLEEQGRRYGLSFLAWCLMTNHVHLIAVPSEVESLARGIGEAHRRYTRMVNSRKGVRGYLFQGRFFSCPLDERRLFAAVRYVLRNPVRAGVVEKPEEYIWSSARWHVGMIPSDPLVKGPGPLAEIDDWEGFLTSDPEEIDVLREHTRTGRPYGGEMFVAAAERATGRVLRKRRPGRPRREK